MLAIFEAIDHIFRYVMMCDQLSLWYTDIVSAQLSSILVLPCGSTLLWRMFIYCIKLWIVISVAKKSALYTNILYNLHFRALSCNWCNIKLSYLSKYGKVFVYWRAGYNVWLNMWIYDNIKSCECQKSALYIK